VDNRFFTEPIRNSPYEYPREHWGLDAHGQPTQRIIEGRRQAEFITPIPKPRKRKDKGDQSDFVFDEGKGISTEKQQYNQTSVINELRYQVDQWRNLPNPNDWQVTPETARLLQHWRHYKFSGVRPFFCQIEAAETAIWLTEVAPNAGNRGKRFIEHLANSNSDANPELMRLALKLATGAGKTTVMAMLIAWQTINAVRRAGSSKFTRGFLVVTLGLTIRDRLRVLQQNDPDSYYKERELVPGDMLPDIDRAKIVIRFALANQAGVARSRQCSTPIIPPARPLTLMVCQMRPRGPSSRSTHSCSRLIDRVWVDLCADWRRKRSSGSSLDG